MPQCSEDGSAWLGFTSGRWRPYGQVSDGFPVLHGLACSRLVAPHPSLLVGDAITVCVSGAARDGLLVPAVAAAAGDWNDLLAPGHDNPDPALRRGLGYAPFAFDAASPDCPSDIRETDTDYVQVSDERGCFVDAATTMCAGGGRLATADTRKSGDPPRVTRNVMRILVGRGGDAVAIREELERLVRHELGHFLGLADYFAGCWRLMDSAGVVQPSVMSYGQLPGDTPDGVPDPAGCLSDDVTARDLEDAGPATASCRPARRASPSATTMRRGCRMSVFGGGRRCRRRRAPRWSSRCLAAMAIR